MSADSLTLAQREAVEHIHGPLLVLAGPGSGKTRVVMHRIANMLNHDISPRQIVALTFTNKAADEMRLRLEQMCPGQSVWISTFHRFCARFLRQYGSNVGLSENFTIYDAADSRKVIKRTIQDLGLQLSEVSAEGVARGISRAKNQLVTFEQFQPRSGSPKEARVAEVYRGYQQRLLDSNAVDFDDLLLYVAQLLGDFPELRRSLDEQHQYILVDEYQDTNRAQYTIVRALSADYPNLAVTGDPDQSIYGWRGASLTNILEFESDFSNVKVVRLEQNYRSTQRILHVADAVISRNKRRKPKSLFTENQEGPPVRLVIHSTQREEAQRIASSISDAVESGRRRPRDFGIFYRINALSRSLEQALLEQDIPYQIANGLEFYRRKEVKDVLAYLFLINNPRDDVALQRVINCPPRGIGKTTLGRLTEYATANHLPLLEAARQSGMITSIKSRMQICIARFVALIDRLSEAALAPLEEIIGLVLSQTGYHDYLTESEELEDQDRLANIQELLTAARQFDELHLRPGQLEEFLEHVALVNDTDRFELQADRVMLMTLHAAKGLEFPVVHIIALEDNLLPHERSRDDPNQLEEERRLTFVGITRAKEELELSFARTRDFRGLRRPTIPSMFLMEMPRDQIQTIDFSKSADPDDHIEADWHDEAQTTVPSTASDRSTAHKEKPAILMTAADLISQDKRPQVPVKPETFEVGMMVHHPTYQLGRVVALSGSQHKRTATVQFFSEDRPKKFRIDSSQLQPVSAAD